MSILEENGQEANRGPSCHCAEGRYEDKTGEIVPTGLRVHSCAFVKLKNSFIPQAAAYADLKVPDDRGGIRWSKFFSRKMSELVRGEAEAAD